MKAGTHLSEAALLAGQDSTRILVTHGPRALALLQAAQAGLSRFHRSSCWLIAPLAIQGN